MTLTPKLQYFLPLQARKQNTEQLSAWGISTTKMTSIRPFEAMDIFKFNTTNLAPLTETYELNFYFSYLARWPHLFNVAEGRDGTIDAYSMSALPPLCKKNKKKQKRDKR